MRKAQRVFAFSVAALAVSTIPAMSGTRAGRWTPDLPASVAAKASPPPNAKVHPAPPQPSSKDATGADKDNDKTQDSGDGPAATEGEPAASVTWSPSEIADAQARCAVILKRIQAVSIAHATIREGACGAPAPIELVSIGKNPEVVLSPTAIVTCEMAEGLYTWMKGDVQPLAKQHLGADVIKIETMSDYACRNAYGRKGNKLSEHGRANALDIRGFVTATAKTAYVLENWGKPQREINAEIAAAKAAEEKRVAALQAAEKAAQANQQTAKAGSKPAAATPPSSTASAQGAPAAGIAKSSVVAGTPRLTVTLPGAQTPAALSLAPDKLGGPKPKPAAFQPQDFLRAVHASACRIFGTTLGPEANADHRNHLHIDMAERKATKICD